MRRGPGIANLAGAVVMLAVVVVLAFKAQAGSMPQIAEFAPTAQHPINQAPAEQSSSLGSAGAGGGRAAPVKSPSPGPGADGTGAVYLHCVGDPPRQTEDPQSPPCVPYWAPPAAGGNGGATSRGVLPESINVAEPQCDAAEAHALQQFFNTRYELYGRHLNISCPLSGESCTPSQQRADAQTVVQGNFFASLFYNSCGGVDYMDELADRHVIGISSFGPAFSQSYLAGKAPYLWQYEMDFDSLLRTEGAWACARLAGGRALYAGDAATQAEPRKFGIIFDRGSAAQAGTTALLRQALNSCGADVDSFEDDYTGQSGSDTGAQTTVLRFKSDHVTSIFCLCSIEQDTVYAGAATGMEYFPEWLLSSYATEDYNQDIGLAWPSEQRAHAFGITVQPRQLRWADDPTAWALVEGSPTGGWVTATGPPTNANEQPDTLHEAYRGLLILASGIQMAGPHLTPDTFAAALHRTVFPNPDTSIRAGHVSFLGGSYSMTVDAAEFWWSNSAPSPYGADDGSGSICYVDHGARHSIDSWPRGGSLFFAGTCDSGANPGDP